MYSETSERNTNREAQGAELAHLPSLLEHLLVGLKSAAFLKVEKSFPLTEVG